VLAQLEQRKAYMRQYHWNRREALLALAAQAAPPTTA
jgi:hypothetical protein